MAHVVRSHNLKVNRRKSAIRAYVMDHPEVDVWLLQEAHQYRAALDSIPGLRLHMPQGKAPGAILVRETLPQVAEQPLRMQRTWRRPRMPGQHPPRIFPVVTVEGIRYVPPHIPERRDSRPDLLRAREECYDRLSDLLADGRPTLLGGDWNGRPGETGRGLPGGFIAAHDLQVKPLGRIDFFAGRGVRITDVDVLPKYGSDHTAIQADVRLAEPPPPPPPGDSMLLTDLADAARSSGLEVVEIDGWETRRRPPSTGGFKPRGILCHHTGGPADGLAYAEWLAKVGRADLPAPLCQLALGRDGTVYVCAAGRANHAGTAKAVGPLPGGDGNELYVGIEAMNTGSEGWTTVQRDAYVRLCAALCRWYDWPASHVRAHKETSVTGKWDPGQLDMPAFRQAVADQMEDEMALTDADKQWIREAVAEAVRGNTLDVGKENAWADDKVAEVVLNTLGRIEARLTTLTQEAGK